DAGQLPAVRALAGRHCRDDLRIRPLAQSGFFVGREIGADENADAGNPESDIGAAENASLVRRPQKCARRMAVRTAAQRDQIMAAIDLRLVRESRGLRSES